MAKLKRIVQQLSESDYRAIYDQLEKSGAEKSTFLLRSLRESNHQNRMIIKALGINTNAYYTLRSRLSQKIEEHLVSHIETPRAGLLQKVASLPEVVFIHKRALAVATLKKLEKELMDYDLSRELIVVYKHLRTLHLHEKEGFHYSRLYNRQVAYTLAMDKAEERVLEYFKKYGTYYLDGNPQTQTELELIRQELTNLHGMYDSHRLYMYRAIVTVFHRIHMEDPEGPSGDDQEPTENIFAQVYAYFAHYTQDATYYHFHLLFDFLQLEYYYRYGIYRKAEGFYEDLSLHAPRLLSAYSYYTFPSNWLYIALHKGLREGKEAQLDADNEARFADYTPNEHDIAGHLAYTTYRALCCYYAGRYEAAMDWLYGFLSQCNLKGYPEALLNVKALLALQYVLVDDYDLFTQTLNSMQRLIRLIGKTSTAGVSVFVKMLRIAMNQGRKGRQDKILQLASTINYDSRIPYHPLSLIKMDKAFAENLCKIRVAQD